MKGPPPYRALPCDRLDPLPLQVQIDGAVDLDARGAVAVAQILQGGVLDLHEVDARQIDLVPLLVGGLSPGQPMSNDEPVSSLGSLLQAYP